MEDNPLDVALTRRVFARQASDISIRHASDGLEAVEFLRSDSEPLPSLVLLDLNLPKMNGVEVLNAMRSDAALRCIPVIMLTTSTREEDIRRCYEAGANAYIVKPVDLAEFQRVIDTLRLFWTEMVTLPEPQSQPRQIDSKREAA